MKIPQTQEEMQVARYSLFHVAEVSGLKSNTLQVMIKNRVVVPAIPSEGQGFPSRFNYINLLEAIFLGTLVSMGINEHKFLEALLNSGKKYNPNKAALVEHFRAFDFSHYLLLPGMRHSVHEGAEGAPLSPVWFDKLPEELEAFISLMRQFPGWVVMDTGLLKNNLDRILENL